MANFRQNALLNKNISSEGTMGNGSGNTGQPQGFSNIAPSNTNRPATMPDGFVNFDRLINQNQGTINNKAAQLDKIAGNVRKEADGLSSGLRGAGTNTMSESGLSGLMKTALSASKGDGDAEKRLQEILNPSMVEENKPLTESAGYTEGMNKLNRATLAPKDGQDNYGGGALDYALGDAFYGNKIRDQIAQSTASLDKSKNDSVMRNKEIQDYNTKLGAYRDKMKSQATNMVNDELLLVDNPTKVLQTGDPFYKAQEARDSRVGSLNMLAKYLGIDPGLIKSNSLDLSNNLNTVWNKEENRWVAPTTLMPPKTPEQIEYAQERAGVKEDKNMKKEAERRASRASEYR
jgi:hypothetical protein